MRMDAETMKRNGIVHATARDMLSYGDLATVEQIAAISGYDARDVKKAVKSLISQGVMEAEEDAVTKVKPFTERI